MGSQHTPARELLGYCVIISAVRLDSVSGTPRSRALLSAMASSRRIRPAIASLVSGGLASWPSSSRLACRCSMRSRPATVRCSGASVPRISSARSTRAPAATAARALRRRLASSKLASRLAVARTSRRIRRSSQASTAWCAPSLVSMAAIASPSLITTRSTPRTSRALACTFSRRAAPIAPHLSAAKHLLLIALAGLLVTAVAGHTLPTRTLRMPLDDRAPSGGRPARPDRQASAWRQALRTSRAVGLFGLIALCAAYDEGAIGDWGALHLRQDLGAGAGLAAAGYAAFALAEAIGRLSGTALLERLGRTPVLIMGGLIA